MQDTREIAEEYRLTHWTEIMQDRSSNGLSISSYCKEAGLSRKHLLLLAAQATLTAIEPGLTEVVAPYRRRKRLINDKENLPEDISVEAVEHSLPQEEQICPECGEALHPIGPRNHPRRACYQPGVFGCQETRLYCLRFISSLC